MKSIFVGNLAFSATEDDLWALFRQYRSVERVNIITDRATGRSRGFGFVEMGDDDEGDAAIAALNGYELNGRALRVDQALAKGSGRGARTGAGRSREGREPRW